MGGIGVVQMEAGVDVYSLRPKFIEQGVWVRPFGDIIYLTPAFTVTGDELAQLTQSITTVIKGL